MSTDTKALLDSFVEAAKECAAYIYDSSTEQLSYQTYIEEGNDPRDHILYYAARVLDKDSEFDVDIEEYEKEIHENV
jgi:hypothetical protein